MTKLKESGSLVLVFLLAAMAQSALAQDLAMERRAVLRSFGKVEHPELNLFPVLDEPGIVYAQRVAYSGAESLRLHFIRLNEDAADGTWEIRVLQNGEVKSQTTNAELATGSYWSDEYVGSSLRVELHSTTADNPIKIQIADVAVRKMAPSRLSITGENQLVPITRHAAWVQNLGKSIARLRFVADDGEIYSCTAFLVSPNLMLTNQHCIAGRTELESALVDFDFDSKIAETFDTRLSTIVASDYELDYSLVELVNVVDRTPLTFDESTAKTGQELLIIQHPGGEPKQVSVDDCAVGEQSVKGRSDEQSDFEHLCDTETGSSGSPVIDWNSRSVVGLHHLGFEEDNNNLLNRAVHITLILNDLDGLRARIMGPAPENEVPDEE